MSGITRQVSDITCGILEIYHANSAEGNGSMNLIVVPYFRKKSNLTNFARELDFVIFCSLIKFVEIKGKAAESQRDR